MHPHIPKPKYPDDFERLCERLFRDIFDAKNLSRFGRPGTSQYGIDLIGNRTSGEIIVVQCKSRLQSKLRFSEITSDLEKSESLKHVPQLFIVATSASSDPTLQEAVIALNSKRIQQELIPIELWMWERIEEAIHERPRLLSQILLSYGFQLSGHPSSQLDNQPRLASEESQSPSEPIDAMITERAELAQTGHPNLALERLQNLLATKLSECNAHHRFRIFANIGHAHLLNGDYDDASSSYLKARREEDTRDSRMLEIRALAFRGEHDKCLELTSALLKDDPKNTTAHWARIMLAAPSVSVAALARSIPQELASNSELLMALSHRARISGDMDAAIRYAQCAHDHDPDWKIARVHLAGLILEIQRSNAVISEDGSASVPDPKTLRRVIELVQTVIDDSTTPPHIKSHALLNHSSASRLLGDTQNWRKSLEAAFQMDPHDADIAVAWASTLRDEDRSEDALRALDEIPDSEQTPKSALMYAWIRAPADEGFATVAARQEALSRLESVMPQLKNEDSATRFYFIKRLVALKVLSDGSADTRNWLEQLDDVLLEHTARSIITSWISLEHDDDPPAATANLQPAVECPTDLSPHERYFTALLLDRLGDAKRSLAVLSTDIASIGAGPDLTLLLDLCDRLGAVDVVRELALSLESRGIRHRNTALFYAQICAEYGDSLESLRVLNRWLEEHPDDTSVRLRRSILALENEWSDLVEDSDSALPDSKNCSPETCLNAVLLLLKSPTGSRRRAMKFAYHVLRRNKQNGAAQRAMVTAAFFPAIVDETYSPPKTVSTGHAVTLKSTTRSEILVRIIEPDEAPGLFPEETSPNHAIAEQLLGKSLGDEITIGSMQRKTYRISQIVPREVYRAQRCMAEWQANHPNEFFVEPIHVGDLKPDATADELRAALQPITDSLRAQENSRAQADIIYRERPVPLHLYANGLQADIFFALDRIAQSDELVFHCCHGTAEERAAGIRSLRDAERIVLDDSALATLIILNELELLEISALHFAAPRLFLAQLDTHIEYLSRQKDDSAISIGLNDESPALHSLSSEEIVRQLQFWERSKNLIESNCELFDAKRLLDLESDERDKLEGVFGRSTASAMLEASTQGALCSDDLRSSSFAEERFGVQRIWSWLLFGALSESGDLAPNAVTDLVLQLCQRGYLFVPVSPEVALKAMENVGWASGHPSLTRVWKYFENSSLNQIGLMRTTLGTWVGLWERCSIPELRQMCFQAIAHSLDKREDGRQIGKTVLNAVDPAFGLDIVKAESLKAQIQSWLSSPIPVIQVPGLWTP